MESTFTKIVDVFLNGTGVMGALFVLSLVVIYFLWRENRATEKSRFDEAKACDELVRAQFEKRLEEARTILPVLQATTTSMAALTQSVDVRGQVSTKQAEAFTLMVAEQQANKEYFRQLGERLERKLDTLTDRANRSGP